MPYYRWDIVKKLSLCGGCLMKNKIKQDFFEYSILLCSLAKWTVLAVFAGGVVGIATAFFLYLLHIGENNFTKIDYYYLFIPIAFFISSYLIIKFAPDAEGHGTEKVIEAVHKKSGEIDIKVIPVKLMATLVTLIAGGSAGKEGPCAQIGAGIASSFANMFKLSGMDKKRFVVCGVSAGFAGVFGTPIAGAIFAAEVLYVGRFSYLAFLPSLISSYVSLMINKAILGGYPEYIINFNNENSIKGFLGMVLFGLVIGLVAMIFIRVLHIIEEFIKNIKIYKPLKGIIGGLILVLVVILTGTKDYIGLGTGVIDHSLAGTQVRPISFIAKMFTTSVTLGSGGSGGILTPIFYIGSTFGNLWGTLINNNIALFSAIGMVAFLAATANTPIAAIIMAMELFGVEVASLASIACVVSYLTVGHRSVYPSQILALGKTPSIDFETDKEIKDVGKVRLVRKGILAKKYINRIANKSE